jgi:formate dehydrogenase major subunit
MRSPHGARPRIWSTVIFAHAELFHNTEWFQDAGRSGLEYSRGMARHQHRPMERLTTPLVRDGGELRPAGWDEALARAAAGLRTARDERGGRSIGIFSCSKSTNEMNFVAQKLARAALGTNNIDSCNRT